MKLHDNTSNEVTSSTLSARKSRRGLIKGAVAGAAGVAGIAVAGTALMPHGAHAAPHACATDSVQTILNIAVTAEQLAVTFYSNGIKNAKQLGISGQNLNYLTGAVVAEQLHRDLLVSSGGKPLTGLFSFHYGPATFERQDLFIKTLNELETVFESAYLVAIRDFALIGRADLALLAGQIVTVEAEHRALGRSISSDIATANNWAYTPVHVKSVSSAAVVLGEAGYLSPKGSNSYQYHPVNLDRNQDVIERTPFVIVCS